MGDLMLLVLTLPPAWLAWDTKKNLDHTDGSYNMPCKCFQRKYVYPSVNACLAITSSPHHRPPTRAQYP